MSIQESLQGINFSQSHALNKNQSQIICRICLEQMNEQEIFSFCKCKSSNSHVHEKCLLKWLQKSHLYQESFFTYYGLCDICKQRIYVTSQLTWRCLTCQEIKQELFQKQLCCTISTFLFSGGCLMVLIVIIAILPNAQSFSERIVYYIGVILASLMLGISLLVYTFYYLLKFKSKVTQIKNKKRNLISSKDNIIKINNTAQNSVIF